MAQGFENFCSLFGFHCKNPLIVHRLLTISYLSTAVKPKSGLFWHTNKNILDLVAGGS